jgi:hypothetical protein
MGLRGQVDMTKSDDDQKMKIIPDILYGEDFSELDKLDVSLESYMHRMDSLKALLVEKAGFSDDKASNALTGSAQYEDILAIVEEAAEWARGELSRLKIQESKNRSSRDNDNAYNTPVLHGDNVGSTELSDLAITLLTAVESPGENLTLLLAELLNVDRHRQTLAENDGRDFGVAAQIVAQKADISQSDLAKSVGKNKSTISRWMKDPKFTESVESYRKIFKGEFEKKLKSRRLK